MILHILPYGEFGRDVEYGIVPLRHAGAVHQKIALVTAALEPFQLNVIRTNEQGRKKTSCNMSYLHIHIHVYITERLFFPKIVGYLYYILVTNQKNLKPFIYKNYLDLGWYTFDCILRSPVQIEPVLYDRLL